MWSLISACNDKVYYIFVGEEYVVGRKEASILLSNDPSVSRKHASLYVKHLETNLVDPNKPSLLFVKDERSKYGTFKNGVRLTEEEEILNNGDILMFGQMQSKFKVCFTPLIITSSCLQNSLKQELKKIIFQLGGHLVSEWYPSCTHLVMSEIKVTIKALCSLLSLKPIVTLGYFENLKNHLKLSKSMPPFNNYLPPIGETLIDQEKVSFDVNPDRKSLFHDKTFIFLDEKQFKKLHLGITLGGGKAIILSKEEIDTNLILHKDTCVVQPPREQNFNEEVKFLLKKIVPLLLQHKRRIIPEPDIGLAVAYCSLENFCNPYVTNVQNLLETQTLYSQTFSQEVYVPDTESCASSIKELSFEKPSSMAESISTNDKSINEDCQNISLQNNNMVISESQNHKLSTSENEIHQKKRGINAKNFSSLNLSSFNDGKTNCSSNEIILSEPIKQELEDLFDNMEWNDEILSESTQPLEINKNEKNLDDVNESEVNKNDIQMEKNLPSNLAKIQIVSLVKRTFQISKQSEKRNIKNFKKFKKVYPTTARAFPKIIGAHELIAHNQNEGSCFNESIKNLQEDLYLEQGEFDWESQAT